MFDNLGDKLDGEGGFTVWGRLMPAADSVEAKALPIGLASGIGLARRVEAGRVITLDDLEPPPDNQAWKVRAQMLKTFA